MGTCFLFSAEIMNNLVSQEQLEDQREATSPQKGFACCATS